LKVIVIIPTLNEENNIEIIIKKIIFFHKKIKILVVDDESKDNTINIVKKINKKQVSYVIRKKDKGLGSAHKYGILYSYLKRFDYCITMDADGTHDPKKIDQMINYLKYKNYDIINTSRFVQKNSLDDWPLYRKFLTKLRFYIVKIILNTNFDSSGGFRAYNLKKVDNKFLNLVKNNNYFFLIESLFYLEKLGYKIKDIPIKLKFRAADQSKMRLFHIMDSLWSLIKLRLKNNVQK
jgi:dolichol-phosphate mannosyltransferase